MAEEKSKYRLALLEDRTLREVFHIRVSALGAFSFLTLVFVLLIALLSVLIIYTPIRNILPGYSESIRQQLIVESERVDSLEATLTLQRNYLDVIKQLTAGDISSDSVQRLDSMEMVQRARLAEAHNQATEEFLAQYEQKERDQLLLFDSPSDQSVQRLFRPVRGVIVRSARIDQHQYAVRLRVAKNENVLAVLRGTILYAEREWDQSYTLILQHRQYTSIYRHVSRPLKAVGTVVEAGESIGLMDGEHEPEFELWRSGQAVNPEEVIVW